MTPKELLQVDPKLQLYDEIVKDHPSLIEPFLNIFIDSTEKDLETSKNTFKYDLSLFCTGEKETMKKFNNLHRHVQLIDSGNIDMLLHPIMRVVTDLKWSQFIFNFLVHIFFFLLFLLFFSWYGYGYIDMTQCTPLNLNNLENPPIESTCAESVKAYYFESGFHAVICTKNNTEYSKAIEKYGKERILLCEGLLDKCRKKSWRSKIVNDPDK